jgi:hypothetical protein
VDEPHPQIVLLLYRSACWDVSDAPTDNLDSNFIVLQTIVPTAVLSSEPTYQHDLHDLYKFRFDIMPRIDNDIQAQVRRENAKHGPITHGVQIELQRITLH